MYEIKLVDIPAWRLAVLEPVPVPARLTRPHTVVRAMQNEQQPLGLTRPVQGRALRLIQALITAAEAEGHSSSAGATGFAPPSHRRRRASPHFTGRPGDLTPNRTNERRDCLRRLCEHRQHSTCHSPHTDEKHWSHKPYRETGTLHVLPFGKHVEESRPPLSDLRKPQVRAACNRLWNRHAFHVRRHRKQIGPSESQ
ncbi:hypothetical protein ACFW2K_18125 [Streptomyces nigra]|uniref:hypothetical protein n=1 Tax=Streptomyces nigra TaxID=1827580 RepID=UPI0036B9601E